MTRFHKPVIELGSPGSGSRPRQEPHLTRSLASKEQVVAGKNVDQLRPIHLHVAKDLVRSRHPIQNLSDELNLPPRAVEEGARAIVMGVLQVTPFG